MVIRLHTGSSAASFLADPDFIARWGALSRQDPKFTAHQEPPFVTSWYSIYHQRYQPLLCLGYSDEGELAGVMPLALDALGGLVHAGAHQAEYHGWIAHPAVEGRFPAACLIELAQQHDLDTWSWRWLPPGAPLDWLHAPELAQRGIVARVQEEQDSPLWDLHDPRRLEKLLKNRGLRNKLNRYRRRCGLRLERITDPKRGRVVFPTLVDQCDFRQGAIHGIRPFASDSSKLPFYLQRMDHAQANHFTVLWAGDRPLASNFGACSADTVLNGLTTFDPAESRNSPGRLLLLELARKCVEEGFRYIDMTPGADAYKEEFSNARRRLVMPTFHFRRVQRLAADLRRSTRRSVKAALVATAGEPRLKRVRSGLEQLGTALAGAAAAPSLGARARALYNRQKLLVFRVDTVQASPGEQTVAPPEPPLQRQRYQELLHSVAGQPEQVYRPLFQEALRRFAAGDVLYTAVDAGKLLFCGWRSAARTRHTLWTGGPQLETDARSVLIYGLRLDGTPTSQLEGWLDRMIADAAEGEILVSVDAEDGAARAMLDGRGATLHERLEASTLLGG